MTIIRILQAILKPEPKLLIDGYSAKPGHPPKRLPKGAKSGIRKGQ